MSNSRTLILALAATGFASATAGKAQSGGAVDAQEYVWDLSAAYADDVAWETERATIQQKLGTIGRFSGTLGRSPSALAEGLDAISDLRSRAARMAVYGTLLEIVDSRSATAQSRAAVGASSGNR